MEDVREKKISKLRKWVSKTNGYKFARLSPDQMALAMLGVVCFVKKRHKKPVAVCICEPEEEQSTYETLASYAVKPVFIRESDSDKFLQTKIRNALSLWVCSDFDAYGALSEKGKVKSERMKAEKAKSKMSKGDVISEVKDLARPRRPRFRIHQPVYEKVNYNNGNE